ncbi:hypothetical protein cypCar_00025965 [Cyprinus carpio]|nr:hypothetical protein cypCar_00025965 [Cyprinus carpio]
MAGIVCRIASRVISSQAACSSVVAVRHSHWFTSVLSLKTSMPLRIRDAPKLCFEESERRALLLKEWSRYKYSQHQTEMDTINEALEAQRQALDELKLESEELYKAALSPDMDLFPFQHEGPSYTPPVTNYDAPEGKYNDVTRVYTQ